MQTDAQDRTPAGVGIRRSVPVGGLTRSQVLSALQQHSVSMNVQGETLFRELRFEEFSTAQVVETVEVTVGELGFAEGATSAAIYERARSLGLGLLQLEAAPYLRLHYLDQPPDGVHVTIASPPRTSPPSGFYLRSLPDGVWLRGYTASDDWEFGVGERFLFRRG